MLLRVLIYLIRPSDEQLHKRNNRWFIKTKIWLYKRLLRRLLRSYNHYAIYDTILLNQGRIKVVHEYRDLEFESELRRNKITFKEDVVSQSFPLVKPKSSLKWYFGYFRFKSKLSLYADGKELFISHDDNYSVDGTLLPKIKSSVKEDAMTHSIIKVVSSYFKEPTPKEQQETKEEHTTPILTATKRPRHKSKSQKRTGGMFDLDRDVVPITPREESEPKQTEVVVKPHPDTIEKRGFEIDISF